MKVLVVTRYASLVGGVERYLADVVPALMSAGVEVAVAFEVGVAEAGHSWIPAQVTERIGLAAPAALDSLRGWAPDVVYTHGLEDDRLELAITQIAPSVAFLHNYYGTCISGAKRFAWPRPQPCGYKFGPPCLVRYFPRRCGGLNPVTMVGLYNRQRRRLDVLERCAAVLTHSSHMFEEYARYGLEPGRLERVVFYSADADAGVENGPTIRSLNGDVELVFVGRLDWNKGVRLLLDAVPRVARTLGRAVHLRIVGDGPEGNALRRDAQRVEAPGSVRVSFLGWLERDAIQRELDESHLLVVPSVWPEPFGLVGIEAGARGLPAAAFAVGGIPEWLQDGVNGCLAPGDPPTAAGLTDAIVRCLAEPGRYFALRDGARRLAWRFNRQAHLSQLLAVFGKVVSS